MAERVLLTGASGFVGRAVIDPLRALGFEVHAVGRSARPDEVGLRWHGVDLLDTDAPRALLRDIRPSRLVHAAWYVEHGKFWTAPENAAWVEASEALAAAFVEAGGYRFLGVGSCAEYADVAGDDAAPWPESRPLAPATPYGRAKAALAARLVRIPRLSLAWARLFLMFGDGENPARLVPSICASLAAGQEARCASGRPVRDFASTRFIGQALAAVLASPVEGPVNVASGEGRAIADVATFLGDAAGRPGLIRLGALADRPGDVPEMVADVARLRRAVGFAVPAAVEQDLRAMLARFLAAAKRRKVGDGGRDRD